MATERYVECRKCGPVPVKASLFDTLLEHSRNGSVACPPCSTQTALRLRFAFGLGAGHPDCTVLKCFVPRRPEKWKDLGGHAVTFYPFLVILKRHPRKRAVWLPYWHIVGGKRRRITKYGQWAPFMDEHLFADLLRQARENGYLVRRSAVRPSFGSGANRSPRSKHPRKSG